MKLRDDWRNLRKMYSVRVKVLGTTVAAAWVGMPDWIKVKLPAFAENVVVCFCGALFIIGVLVQCIDQELGEKPEGNDNAAQ